MRVRAVAALGVLCLFAAMAWADDVKNDAEKLQGTWIVVSGEDAGKPLPVARTKETQVVIAKDRILLKEDQNAREMTFQVDSGKTPRAINMTIIEGKDKGKVCEGIYALEGDILKLCFAPVAKERPMDFTTKPGMEQMLLVMKRQEK